MFRADLCSTVFHCVSSKPTPRFSEAWCSAPHSPGREVGRSKASCRDLLDPVVQFQPPGGWSPSPLAGQDRQRHHRFTSQSRRSASASVRSQFRPSLQSLGLNMHFYARSSHPSAKTISLRGELYHCGCNSHLYGPKDGSYGRNRFFIKMGLRGGRNTTVSFLFRVASRAASPRRGPVV